MRRLQRRCRRWPRCGCTLRLCLPQQHFLMYIIVLQQRLTRQGSAFGSNQLESRSAEDPCSPRPPHLLSKAQRVGEVGHGRAPKRDGFAGLGFASSPLSRRVAMAWYSGESSQPMKRRPS